MGKSKYVRYRCSLCDYGSPRRWNVQRHIMIPAHNKPASILIVRNGKKEPQSSSAHGYLTLQDTIRTKLSLPQLPVQAAPHSKKDYEFIDPLINEIELWIKLFETTERLMRVPGQPKRPSSLALPKGWAPLPTQGETSTRAVGQLEQVGYNRPLGYRGYVCPKCYSYGIVEFGVRFQGNKTVSFYGGICNHPCSGQKEVEDPRQLDYVYSRLNNQLYDELVKLSGEDLYLIAREIPDKNVQAREEFNPINFGLMNHNDTLYPIIKDGLVSLKVRKEFIFDFFNKTLSTYCLASIEEDGKKRLFFLIILPKLNAS